MVGSVRTSSNGRQATSGHAAAAMSESASQSAASAPISWNARAISPPERPHPATVTLRLGMGEKASLKGRTPGRWIDWDQTYGGGLEVTADRRLRGRKRADAGINAARAPCPCPKAR